MQRRFSRRARPTAHIRARRCAHARHPSPQRWRARARTQGPSGGTRPTAGRPRSDPQRADSAAPPAYGSGGGDEIDPNPRSYDDVPSWAALRAALAVHAEVPAPTRETWWTWARHEVHLDVHEPPTPPRGTVVLVHGGGGHGRLLSAFAAPVAKAGFRVVAPDLPGFGLTRVPAGRVPSLADWVALVAALAAEQPGPVVLLGLSLGGTAALHAAMASDAVDGVLASTLLDLQHRPTLQTISTVPWAVAGLPLVRGALARLPVRIRHLAPLDRMSSDPRINALLASDPLIGARRIGLGFFASLARTPPPEPIETFGRVPIQIVHPAADVWTPPALSRRTFDRLPGPKRWVDLPEGGHLPVEPAALDQLRVSVAAFLDEVAGPAM